MSRPQPSNTSIVSHAVESEARAAVGADSPEWLDVMETALDVAKAACSSVRKAIWQARGGHHDDARRRLDEAIASLRTVRT
jgi:hypothetical protein